MQQNDFQQIPVTFWVYILLPFAVIAATLVGLDTHNPFMFGLIGVLPFCILLLNRVDFWLVTIFAVYNSRLRIPGVLGQLELVHVLIAGLVAVVFLRWIIQKQGASRKAWMWKFLYFFGAVLAVTVFFQGSGFRLLGDTKWGGMRYVEVFLTLSFPFVVTQLRLTPQQWKVAMIAMSLMALIPTIADVVFIVSNGSIYHHYYVIRAGAVRESVQAFGSGEITRFKSAATGGGAILFLPFILFPATARNFWKYALFITIGIFFSSISGFRLGIINAIAFLWVYVFIVFRRHRVLVVITSLLVSLLGLAFVLLLMPYLPLSIQRAFSFIPFANVDPWVEFATQNSNAWRWNVWRNALLEVPDYLLLGKGYTFDPQLLASEAVIRDPAAWAQVNVAYHNGPLSLLIGMGVFGLIAGVGFLVMASVRHYRLTISAWQDSTLLRFHQAFVALFIVRSIVYVTLYGDMHQSFPGLFKLVAILEGLVLADRFLKREADSSPDESIAKETVIKPIRISPY